MNCFVHDRSAAVGLCSVCQRAVCHDCVARASPRLVCSTCIASRAVAGFEYRSAVDVGGWPLVHVCLGVDAVTMRPRVAKGVIAIGNVAIGGLAIGGVAGGLVTVGGVSLGLLVALGGVALGLGLSLGGLAVGAVAIGGAAIGFFHALGGLAIAPSIIDGTHCDAAAAEFLRRWLGSSILPPHCE